MDENLQTSDPTDESNVRAPEPAEADDPRVEEASSKYLSSWNHLISTTNWEKGHIINEWREALRAVGAPASSFSDEAWSRQVGNVSPQHVGRLRRVHQRFRKTYTQYEGLYWSHFQAALDWDDAEMWLEGAVQSNWSVAAMRERRWESVGAPADQKPRDEDLVLAELDEDVSQSDDSLAEVAGENNAVVQAVDEGLLDDERSYESESDASDMDDSPRSEPSRDPMDPPDEPIRPFEDLPTLPADLHEAVESMKLAILNHKMAGWRDVRCDDVLAVLNALKQLAMAPSET
ncbi:MAG: hypothetical protein JW888_09865 [Pirellulales bacterium]|nr:hypothetical protein [Pirellulales bacterium]